MFRSLKFVGLLVVLYSNAALASDNAISSYVDGLINSYFSIIHDAKLTEDDKVKKAKDLLAEKLDREYVKKPDKQKLLDAALTGMLNSLDPYSTYFKPKELKDMEIWTKGEFGGIGIELSYESGAIKVIAPIDDLPAEKAGIKAGDYIVAVNGETVSSMGYNNALREIKGEPGTNVKISVLRDGEDRVKEYEITRAIVQIKPVKYQLDGDVAYVKLVVFNEHTTSELRKAIKAMNSEAKRPIKGLVLDMRNNPGGIISQAVSVSEYFIESGVIVTTKGRVDSSNSSFSASRFASKVPSHLPIVVLINEGSASASEIVAGALQDYKRAVILGTKSFGKGSVQFLTQNPDHSGMKFTTAEYYTPSGRSVDADGITPDIVVEQVKVEYAAKEEEKFSDKSVKNQIKKKEEVKASSSSAENTSNKIVDIDRNEKDSKNEVEMSELYKKDYQYSRAYDLIIGLDISRANRNDE